MHAPDPARAPLQALLQFQATAVAAGDDAGSAPSAGVAALAAFAAWCQQHARGHVWTEAELGGWARVSQALLMSEAAQPVVPLQKGPGLGPLVHDIALLLRAEGVHEDEAVELDLAIRWWEGARRAGLPVDPDFGACWQAIEWAALMQHLQRLSAGAGTAEAEARLLAAVAKVALRYSPLKPLLRLLPAQPGGEVGAGYTF
ncbi:hypothetical protein [Rubrivivax rivuli]|uniref:Uncharacterized protein n=1 Tax=Rubrivivax rivuli TaxID=1862385 RepID=A0A437RQU5_9BURK|nr:hypothetical protein [Rubrivivax rivuli]RVU49166.1 hypothetical protein EOE66_00840 [Rubrivivax rivuli]